MSEPILADPITARLVSRMSETHLRLIRRKTAEIRSHRRHALGGAAPSMSIDLTRGMHDIPQVVQFSLKWSCDRSGGDMRLKSRVSLGAKDIALTVNGTQCEIHREVPAAMLVSIMDRPASDLVDCDLLEGYRIHRINGMIAHLAMPTERPDIALLLEAVPLEDRMDTVGAYRRLREAGITHIDRPSYFLVDRVREYDTMLARIGREIARPGNPWDIPMTDLMTRLSRGATLDFRLVRGEGTLTIKTVYESERLTYRNDILSWAGARNRSWYEVEGVVFGHIHRRPGITQYRSRAKDIEIGAGIQAREEDRAYLL